MGSAIKWRAFAVSAVEDNDIVASAYPDQVARERRAIDRLEGCVCDRADRIQGSTGHEEFALIGSEAGSTGPRALTDPGDFLSFDFVELALHERGRHTCFPLSSRLRWIASRIPRSSIFRSASLGRGRTGGCGGRGFLRGPSGNPCHGWPGRVHGNFATCCPSVPNA